jgi:hypothetical protein
VRASSSAMASVLEGVAGVWVRVRSAGWDARGEADSSAALRDDNKKSNSGSLSGETNVNSRGPTTFLWIKHLFGFCGELW